jgi:hypothetical protein
MTNKIIKLILSNFVYEQVGHFSFKTYPATFLQIIIPKVKSFSTFQHSLKRNREVQVVIDVHPVKAKKDAVDSSTVNEDTTRLKQVSKLQKLCSFLRN